MKEIGMQIFLLTTVLSKMRLLHRISIDFEDLMRYLNEAGTSSAARQSERLSVHRLYQKSSKNLKSYKVIKLQASPPVRFWSEAPLSLNYIYISLLYL